MDGIPDDLDLSPVVGKFTTQIRVGQFDLQFDFGRVRFAVWSAVKLFRAGRQVGFWEPGRWPDAAFFDIMNTEVRRCEVGDRAIVFEFESDLVMHVEESTEHESMEIWIDGQWII